MVAFTKYGDTLGSLKDQTLFLFQGNFCVFLYVLQVTAHPLDTMKSHCSVSISFHLETKPWFYLLIVYVVLLM